MTALKLTPELSKEVCGYVSRGAYFHDAAALVRISEVTLYRWMAKGETEEEPYATFRTEMKLAEAFAIQEAVDLIRNHTSGWQALATWLERRHQKDWSVRNKVDFKVVDAPIEEMTDAQLNKIAAQVEAKKRGKDK